MNASMAIWIADRGTWESATARWIAALDVHGSNPVCGPPGVKELVGRVVGPDGVIEDDADVRAASRRERRAARVSSSECWLGCLGGGGVRACTADSTRASRLAMRDRCSIYSSRRSEMLSSIAF